MDFSKINLADNQEVARFIILEASKRKFKNRRDFEKFRNSVIKGKSSRIFHNLYFIKAYSDLISEGKIVPNEDLLQLIRKRSVRTLSGVAPVTVLTKPYPCPGRCIYCPTDSRMPKSYLTSQPAAQRAFRQQFDPYTQVFVRLKALMLTGHEVSKVELRVIGGSFSAYKSRYQTWFVKRCLLAMNEFFLQVKDGKTDDMNLITHEQSIKSSFGVDVVNTVVVKSIFNPNFDEVVKENESSEVRCIGINVETRPDLINEKEVRNFRRLGVTKVEMGVQTLDDAVHKLTMRGHGVLAVKKATGLLKDAGFKIGYHMMPNLPGSTVPYDKRVIHELFSDSELRPDYLKIYPCVIVPRTVLAEMYKNGQYKPYSEKILQEVLFQNLKDVEYYCRVDRIARDIPSNEIVDGFKSSNVRQILEKRFKDEKIPCKDIRCREIKGDDFDPKNVKLVVREYDANKGDEVFLSYEDVKNDKILALLRLRFLFKPFLRVLKNSALIREIHVYGRQIPVGKHVEGEKQHYGWGSKLIELAEKMAKERGLKKISIISGIGTREYYAKKGYKLSGTYMVKGI